jgi:hypothetical protein
MPEDGVCNGDAARFGDRAETHHGHDSAGRVSSITDAGSMVQCMACTDRGELHRTRGHTPYPVALDTPRLAWRDSARTSPTAASQGWSTATTPWVAGLRRLDADGTKAVARYPCNGSFQVLVERSVLLL